MTTMSTPAPLATVPSTDVAFRQLVSPMTSVPGTGLTGREYGTAVAVVDGAGHPAAAGVALVPAVAAPFATTRPSAITVTPADVRQDVRADVEAAKQASPPRGVPR